MKILWFDEALSDLAQIQKYISNDNQIAASNVAQQIITTVEHLANHPEIGHEGEVSGTREFNIAKIPYRIVYRIRKHLEIITIIHTSRMWPK